MGSLKLMMPMGSTSVVQRIISTLQQAIVSLTVIMRGIKPRHRKSIFCLLTQKETGGPEGGLPGLFLPKGNGGDGHNHEIKIRLQEQVLQSL